MKRAPLLALGAFALAACHDAQQPLGPGPESASIALSRSPGAELIPGRFIVTLREGATPSEVARAHGVAPQYVYRHVLNGFAGAMSDAARAGLLRDARVVRVEQDGIARAVITTQTDATWGLDRIDARAGLDQTYSYDASGSGVKAYIIDTGILTSHQEFAGGRAVHLYDAVDGDSDATDCNGHGTHVAGTVGGGTYGVAKGATLVAVRVLDCGGSGTWSGVIAGMDAVTADHTPGTPAVANLSLGGGANSSVDAAVDRMIDDGISVAVAAGNGNLAGREQDACNYSPARVPRAITIGATSQSDSKTSWSNYGSCVDWFAPGYQITSAWYTSTTATNTISGTSMAAPHVAGVAALYLETSGTASPAVVRDALYEATTKGIVTNSRTANNHLLYSRLGGSGGGTTDAAPSASFTYSCTSLSCSFDGSGSTDDHGITTYAWDFGDGTGTSGPSATTSHDFAAAGTYTVVLTVTDTGAQLGTTSRSVSVSTCKLNPAGKCR